MTTTDECALWEDLLASPRSFADVEPAILEDLATHVDACERCRERSAATPPEVDLFALLARDEAGHEYDQELAQAVDEVIAEQQRDTVTAITDTLYPVFRGTSDAPLMEEVRAALRDLPQPELALWRSVDAVASLVRRFGHQQKPARLLLRCDGAVDLGPGDEIPTTTLAAEMTRSAGVGLAAAGRIVTWLPAAARRIPTLFRGLEGEVTTDDDQRPAVALRVVHRDNLEPLTVRWQPVRTMEEINYDTVAVAALVAELAKEVRGQESKVKADWIGIVDLSMVNVPAMKESLRLLQERQVLTAERVHKVRRVFSAVMPMSVSTSGTFLSNGDAPIDLEVAAGRRQHGKLIESVLADLRHVRARLG